MRSLDARLRAASALLLAALLLTVAACRSGGNADVTGSLVFLEQMTLPEDAAAHVRLVDVTDTSAVDVLAENTLTELGELPIRYTVPYDTTEIDSARTYAIRAEVVSGDEVLLRSPYDFLVLTQGHSQQVDVLLRPPSPPDAPPS
ncbi:MAG: hypothetical protein GVY18_09850 [Bacteroidetes bacterium]|jgi:uncharacterized lipoprotein YbaY|nr:hypothetical protein [Bacteroidota bacterium]